MRFGKRNRFHVRLNQRIPLPIQSIAVGGCFYFPAHASRNAFTNTGNSWL